MSFRDVCRDGDGCTPDLSSEAEAFVLRQVFAKAIRLDDQIHSCLPDSKVAIAPDCRLDRSVAGHARRCAITEHYQHRNCPVPIVLSPCPPPPAPRPRSLTLA